MRPGWVVISFLFFIFLFFLEATASTPRIRVRIPFYKRTLSVYASEMSVETPKYKKKQLNKVSRFKCNTLSSNKWSRLHSSTGPIYIEKGPYLGTLHIKKNHRNKCVVVNELSLEHYVGTLLGKEMNASWPLEALKAQAVAARTYAYAKILKRKSQGFTYDLTSSEKDQVSGNLTDLNHRTLTAMKQTYGQILESPGKIIQEAFYHAECGGRTLPSEAVWQSSSPGVVSVDCPRCLKRSKIWSKKIKVHKVLKALGASRLEGFVPDGIFRKKLVFYTDQGRQSISRNKLRSALGARLISSPAFEAKLGPKGKRISFKGKGRGHGVGMCQVGALFLARNGQKHLEILRHYYPHHNIMKAY